MKMPTSQQILKLAYKVYNSNDADIDQIERLFDKSGVALAREIALFINDGKNWNANAPAEDINELMELLAEMADKADKGQHDYIIATLGHQRIKTNGDILTTKMSIHYINLSQKLRDLVGNSLNEIPRTVHDEYASYASKSHMTRNEKKYYHKDLPTAKVNSIVHPLTDGYISQFNADTRWAINRMTDLTQKIVAGSATPTEVMVRGAKNLGVDKAIDAIKSGAVKTNDVQKLINKVHRQYQHRAQTIVRNEAARIINECNLYEIEQAGFKYVKIVALKDGHVCDDCKSWDGTVVAIKSFKTGGISLPPFHVNCRCIIVVVDLSQDPNSFVFKPK